MDPVQSKQTGQTDSFSVLLETREAKQVGQFGERKVTQATDAPEDISMSGHRKRIGPSEGTNRPSVKANLKKAKAPKVKQQTLPKDDPKSHLAPSARVDKQGISTGLEALRKTGELFTPDPPRKAALEGAGKARLEALASEHRNLTPLLEKAAAKGFTISGRGHGDLSLHLGPMTYALDVGDRTQCQIKSLNKLVDGYKDGHVILGWCVGNQQQGKPGVLSEAIQEHRRVIGEAPDHARISVHTAAHQSQWNPDIVSDHFRGLSVSTSADQDIISQSKLVDESTKRLKDACAYEQQTVEALRSSSAEESAKPQSTGHESFDALVKDGGGPVTSAEGNSPKEAHIREASTEIRGILNRLAASDEPSAVEFRSLLSERQELLMRYAGQKVINKQLGPARKEVQANERRLLETANKVFAEAGPVTRRRAQLALHSMDVLEQIAIGALEPKVFPKSASGQAVRQKALEESFPKVPQDQILNASSQGFTKRIFEAIGDDRSLTYMASQEYEFEQTSKQSPILYVHPSDPGPFLTEEAHGRVDSLVGQALNLSGDDLGPVAAELRGRNA